MKAAAAMTRDVVCVTPEDSLEIAYEIMTEWEIRHLPVLAGKKLVGILSDRDVLVRSELDDDGALRAPATPIAEAMTTLPITCTMSHSVGTIGEAMLEHKIDCLPVVDSDGELMGLVTSSDLIQLLVNKEQAALTRPLPFQFQIFHSVRPGMSVDTLGQVSAQH